MNTNLNVVIPSSIGWDRLYGTDKHSDYPDEFPCMYLLHGFNGDYQQFNMMTNIALYAQLNKIAVVMPSGYNAAYTNMKYGPAFSDFLVYELPEFVGKMFPVSKKVEDTFIAGFSMGGYGALVNGIGHPERYGAAASIAGTLNVDARIEGKTNTIPSMVIAMYGDPPEIDRDTQDVFVMLTNAVKNGTPLPRLYCYSGTEDERGYPRYLMLKEHCEKIGLQDIIFEESSGVHDYKFADSYLNRIIKWMLNK